MIPIGVVQTLQSALSIFFQIIDFLILIRVVLSWIPMMKNTFTELVFVLTEPILGPVRRMLRNSPLGGGMLDFSPVIALFLLMLVQELINGILMFFSGV